MKAPTLRFIAAACLFSQVDTVHAQAPPPPSWPVFRGDAEMTGVARETLVAPLEKAWEFEAEERDGIIATPVVADGRVFIGSLDGTFYALDLKSGEKIWEYKVELAVEGSAAVHGNTVAFGSGDCYVYALTADKGEFKWKKETGAEVLAGLNIYASPDSGRTMVLAGSQDNTLYSYDVTDGKLVWEYTTDGPVNGAPSISGGRIFFGGCDTFIHTISAENGKPIGEAEKPWRWVRQSPTRSS